MIWLSDLWDFIAQTLLQEFVVIVAGVLFTRLILEQWTKWRFGNWHVIVIKDGEEKVRRAISPGKVKEILEEPAELAVFLKGVASPYGWINCDPLEAGRRIGLLQEDRDQRLFTVDLDKNPLKKA